MARDDRTTDLLRFHRSTRGLDSEQIETIASRATLVSYHAGEIVYRAGDQVDAVLLVVAGELEMSVDSGLAARPSPEISRRPIQYVSRDEQFGFLAIYDEQPLPITVTASQQTVVLRVRKEDALDLFHDVPLWQRNVMGSLGPRLRQVFCDEKRKKRPRFIAILHADPSSRELTIALAERLCELQEKVALISDDDHVCGNAPGPAGRLLDEQGLLRSHADIRSMAVESADVDRLIVDASAEHQTSDLSSLIAAADAIYCICTTESAGCTIKKLKSLLSGNPSCKDKLSIVRILGTAEPVAPRIPELQRLCRRDFKLHWQHVDPSHLQTRRAGVERIIHDLRGVSIGLALGGGAARGMAHLGVLRAFESAGIPIDRMAGTSAGALTGVGYAAGLSVDRLVSAFAQDLKPAWFYRYLPYGDALYMLTKYRFGGWEAMLRKYFQDWNLSQLPIPFTSIAADLVSASEVRNSSGDASEAILESINLPFMARPICRDGMALVDGGILNVVPANVLAEQGATVIVAVDVAAKIPFEFDGNGPDTPTARMNRPSTVQTAVRVRTVQDRNIRSHGTGAADLVIEPDVSRIQISDFQHAPQIAELGQHAAEEALPRLRAILHQVDPQLFPIQTEDPIRIAG